ncbi:hypothetical protein D9758_006326 [Tetrapyrgos nigripes]|uniref:BTB domain-containing protein n=1 Tax=Tetrapyrgos nigripes TaxID=182062 RepID=A0A8H5DAA1_9AGAR|nr:hypothetical protein D9758_006326 [Tetrapyrgos nigripes]
MPSVSKAHIPNLKQTHYWDTVIFLVESTLFKVPKYHFETSSEVFRDMLMVPSGAEGPEGTSDANPIRLDGVKAIDFKRLVEILYPSTTTPWKKENKSKDEWLSILRLSNLWRFSRLRSLAIEELTKQQQMDAVEQILLGKEFAVSQWIRAGYKGVIMRKEPLSMDEVKLLDYEPAIRVFRARESVNQRMQGSNCQGQCSRCLRVQPVAVSISSNYCGGCGVYSSFSLCSGGDESSVQSVVDKEFAIEISQASSDSAAYEENDNRHSQSS